MGYPSPRVSEAENATTSSSSTTTTTTSSPPPTESSAAAKTAHLIEEYKQHAAEWAATEGTSYVDVEGFTSSSRSMMVFKGGEHLFFCTAPLVEGGTDAAFHRFLDACATQQQVQQAQKQHPSPKNLIQ